MRPHQVGYRDPVGDQIPAGGHGVAQRGGGCGVDDQGPQPSVVGAHDVGQDVGVELVVFVSGRAVAAPQILDLVGRDHVNDQPGGAHRVDYWAVRAFDAYSGDPGREQLGDHGARPGLVVGDGERPVCSPSWSTMATA